MTTLMTRCTLLENVAKSGLALGAGGTRVLRTLVLVVIRRDQLQTRRGERPSASSRTPFRMPALTPVHTWLGQAWIVGGVSRSRDW